MVQKQVTELIGRSVNMGAKSSWGERGTSPTRFLGSPETRRSDRISLRRNEMWIQLGSLEGVAGAPKSGEKWGLLRGFKHAYTSVRGRTHLPAGAPSTGKEVGSRQQAVETKTRDLERCAHVTG